jgi:hypothetical protein
VIQFFFLKDSSEVCTQMLYFLEIHLQIHLLTAKLSHIFIGEGHKLVLVFDSSRFGFKELVPGEGQGFWPEIDFVLLGKLFDSGHVAMSQMWAIPCQLDKSMSPCVGNFKKKFFSKTSPFWSRPF